MVQNAYRLDAIEAAAQRAEFEDVGLRIIHIVQSCLAGFSSRVGETWQADVDGKDLCVGKKLRDFQGMPAAAAAGYEYVCHTLRLGGTVTGQRGERIDGPTRIGIFF